MTPVDDTVWEGDETLTIAGSAGDLSVTPAEVTIADDDAAPTGVTLTLGARRDRRSERARWN